MRPLGMTLCIAAVTRAAWWFWEHADLDRYASALIRKGWARDAETHEHAVALLRCAVSARCGPQLMAYLEDLPARLHAAEYVGVLLSTLLFGVGVTLARARGRALTVELPGARLQRPVRRSRPRAGR